MTAAQTIRQAEEDFIAAELDVLAAKQLLQEANVTAFRKAIELFTVCVQADREAYINGILALCRTGK